MSPPTPGYPVRNVVPFRSTVRAVAILAAGLLAACGSSRKLDEGIPLCQRCHGGGSGNAAPPTSVGGATATTEIAVGAHQAHVIAGRLRGPIGCGECHVVPADMPEHQAGIAAIAAGTASRVAFGALADRGAGVATWDRVTERCSNTYCHGANLAHGGSNLAPQWTLVDPVGHGEAACGACHDYPPAAPHTSSIDCSSCHSLTVEADDSTIKVGAGGSSTHVDGLLTIDDLGGSCTLCHGFPPVSGAHATHTSADVAAYGSLEQTDDALPADATQYAFGCGHCHPLDFAEHARHFSEGIGAMVTLTPVAGTAASLRGLNSVTASFDPVGGACNGVYCHSTGQASPGFVPSPGWSSGASLGCSGCHANPPSYASGGAGAAAANSHVGSLSFAGDVLEAGHYGGFPAVSHSYSKHGGALQPTTAYWYGESSAPITCQTCHFDTADGANAGPSGFYYLDTAGHYEVGGTAGITLSCTSCHDGTPAQGTGAVRPYFHVNGARDVAFDRRATLDVTGTLTLPAAPNTPTRPYWFSDASAWVADLLPGNMDGTTLSLDLTAATWNASDKSCGAVACHFNRTSVQWGEPLDASATCRVCHDN